MAINIRCTTCKTDMKIGSKKCPKCETPLSKNKKYRVIVRVDGVRVTRTVGTLELAKDVESKLKTDIVRGELDIKKKAKALTLNELWDRYLPWLRTNKKTWKNDEYYYDKHLRPFFGDKRLDEISPFLIDAFVVKMKKAKSKRGTPYAPATIKHQLVLLTRLYSITEKWGLYKGDNPCLRIKKPKLNNQVTEYLNPDQLERLLAVLANWPNKMTAGFVLFCLHTGLRRGELFNLTWQDVDFVKRTVTLRDPKGKLDQTLPVSDKAVAVLNSLPRQFDTSWVFYGKNGAQRSDFRGPWLRIRKAAKLPEDFRLHGLRHHFASSLVNAGVDIYAVQKLLTHKDAATTQRYAHLADKALRDAINLSDSLLEASQRSNIVSIGRMENAK